jgi:hypothetical protein
MNDNPGIFQEGKSSIRLQKALLIQIETGKEEGVRLQRAFDPHRHNRGTSILRAPLLNILAYSY